MSANYANLPRGVHPTFVYLERFFENLLLGGTHELKSRFLHISLPSPKSKLIPSKREQVREQVREQAREQARAAAVAAIGAKPSKFVLRLVGKIRGEMTVLSSSGHCRLPSAGSVASASADCRAASSRHGDWLNKRNSEFDDYVQLEPEKKFDYLSKSFFTTYSCGLKTGLDSQVVGFSDNAVRKNVKPIIGSVCNDDMRCIQYRPFDKEWFCYHKQVNQRQYRIGNLFPPGKYANRVIVVSGVGVSKEFGTIITDVIPDVQLMANDQCFPLYWYEEIKSEKSVLELPGLEKQGGFIKHDAISDFILQEFRKIAGPKVQKEDIFDYVYGALHDPAYRAKFAADLKKQLPRLPLPKNKKDFEKVEKIGRELANLHLHYEEVDPWPLDEIGTLDYHVTKMAWAKDGKAVRKDMLVINDKLTLAGIPAEAHEYVVNGRTPLEWLIERYQVKTDADSGIVNDPNKWGEEHGYPEYIVELVKRVVRVSVETVALVKELGGGAAGVRALPADGRADATERVPPTPTKSATPPYWWKSGVWGVASPIPEGGHVTAGLKHKWYEKIESGLKREEYREMKPFWNKKLGGRLGKQLRSITFMKGQASKEQMTWEVTGVTLSGNWYCIGLGKRLA